MNLLDLLFPRRCVTCGKVGKYICDKCTPIIRMIGAEERICPVCGKNAIDGMTHPRCRTIYGLDGMFAACHYKGPIKDAIHQLKYRFVSDLVSTLSKLFLDNYSKTLPKFDFLVPVPLHKKREKERGFNQSLLLAQIFAKELNISVSAGILKRVRYTKAQVDLKGKERRLNLQKAFICLDSGGISGKSVGLVDDVTTTRTTFIECARVLKRNGAGTVWGLALAHG